MNTRYTTVNLDVSQQGSIPSITLSQYDLGVGLSFYIMDGGLPYSEFAETDTVVLSGTKPSGVGFTVPAYYKSGNLCSFRTTQAMTTEAGTVTCEITITKVNNISVSTANFFVEVEASAHAHETVDEDIEDFGLIADQVGEYKAVAVRAAQQAAQSATDAAASAGSAEESMEAAQSAASSAIAAKDDIQEYIDDSEAWARGTRGGEAVPSTDETYENNAKYYAEQSSEASMAAGSSASEAAASAQEAAASVVGAVKYTAQSLTTEQKAQARTNIGAASPSDIPSGTVRYDTSQSLTDAQKTQAKSNIGVPAVDATLAVTGAAADAKKVGDELTDIKGDLSEITGLSEDIKEALLDCFSHVAWIDTYGQNYYDALENAIYGRESPDGFHYGIFVPETVVNGKYIDNTGVIITGQANKSFYIDDYIPVKAPSYWIGMAPSSNPAITQQNGIGSETNWRLSEYDANKAFIKQTQFAMNYEGPYASTTFLFDSDTKYIRFGWYDPYVSTPKVFDIERPTSFTPLQMEIGDIDGTTGQNAESTARIRSIGYISISGTISVSTCPFAETWAEWVSQWTNAPGYIIRCYNANKEFLSSLEVSGSAYIKTEISNVSLPTGTEFVRFMHQVPGGKQTNWQYLVNRPLTINQTKYLLTE